MLKKMGRINQAVLIILYVLITGKLGRFVSLFAFNFLNCKLTYNLLFYCSLSLFGLLLHSSECNCQLSSSFKMSISLFLAFILSCSLLHNDSYWIWLKDSLGDNCSTSRYVCFLLSYLTVPVKLGTKCPVESNSAVVLTILFTIHPHKCYKGLELDPPGRKVILYQCIYFHWPHWFYAFFTHQNYLLGSSESVLTMTKIVIFMGYFGNVNHCIIC